MARTTPSYALAIQDPVNGRRVSFASNRNLVDNAWFTINQLGATTLPTNETTPWIDRWRFQSRSTSSNTLTWTEDGLVANIASGTTLQIRQRFSEPRLQADKYYMVSCMTADGDIYQVAMKADSSPHWIGGGASPYFNLTMSSSYITLRFVPGSNGKVLRALKIEDPALDASGGIPGTSLAWDSAPDYATELAKCQRYMYVVQPMGSNTEAAVGWASNNGTGGEFNIGVNVPAAMAKVPKVLFSNGTYSKFYVNVQGVDYACTAAPTVSSMSSPNLPVVVGAFNTTSKVFSLAYMKNSGVLILDAENY